MGDKKGRQGEAIVKKIRLTQREFQNPCAGCGESDGATCCTALSIDTPLYKKGEIDVDCIYWYLTRPSFFATATLKSGRASLHPDGWEISIEERCEQLGRNNKCKIYDERPVICSDYSPFPLKDPDENVNDSGYCDRWEPESEKMVFHSSSEFRSFILDNFPKKGDWLKKRQTYKLDKSKLIIKRA